jgi:hypothetical protein
MIAMNAKAKWFCYAVFLLLAFLVGNWRRAVDNLRDKAGHSPVADITHTNAPSRSQTQPPLSTLLSEVLRLRDEVTRAHREIEGLRLQLTNKLGIAESVVTQTAPQSREEFVAGVYAVGEFVNRGYGSPEDCSMTWLWALTSQDSEGFAGTRGVTAKEMPLTGQWATAMGMVAQAAISQPQPTDNGEMTVAMALQLQNGDVKYSWLNFRQADNRWVVSRLAGYPIEVAAEPAEGR